VSGGRLARFRPSALTRGAPTGPLMVLFGLNAVDELDRAAANVLLPEIRDAFGLDTQGVLTLVSIVGFFVLFLEIPIAHLADRRRRTTLAGGGAAGWGVFAFLSGVAPNVWAFGAARGGASLGRAVNGATHPSLLSDYYPVDTRPGVFALHRSASSVGQFVGPLAAGVIGHFLGWRWPFILFSVPTLFLVILAFRLREPTRGFHERTLMGSDRETAETEEAPASMAEAWRILWQVRTLRRLWIATPFLAVAAVGLAPLLQLFYEENLGLDSVERGALAAVTEPFQFVGLFLGIPIASRLLRRDPGRIVVFLAVVLASQAVSLFFLVVTENLPVVVVTRVLLSLAVSTTLPVLAATVSLIAPPRVRSMAFTIGNLFVIPAFVVAPVVGGLADAWGLRPAILTLCPILVVGAVMIGSSGTFMVSDIDKVRTATVTMAEVRAARRRGEAKLLVVRSLDVHYDSVQVLFDVDFEVDEGEIVALLGTNGAGKSTLVKSISGLVDPSAGAIVFDGDDMTYTPPDEVVGRGVVQVPGGKGVFAGLTVGENLRLAGWPYRSSPSYVSSATDEVLSHFPILRTRWDAAAGDLSGGEQQMLTLGMTFVARPRLLMIDELSLGLAPIVVERLLGIVRAIRDRGTTIILVEQSVNVALSLAETAYFMEKGEIRFHGPTAELLERPDILRAVFLEGAGARGAAEPSAGAAAAAAPSVGAPGARRVAVRANVREPDPPDPPDRSGGSDGRAEAGGPALEAVELSRSYGGVKAVQSVSFALPRGAILGVIGPNGAGKTTLFDVVSGYLAPDSGRLLLGGRDVTGLPADARARLGLGRSFQDARLFPGLTVEETLALALERHVAVRDPFATALGLPTVAESEAAVAARVDELVETVGLQAYRSKFVRELSTGTRRIVDLACLLAHEPDVMLFDEPSSGIAQREAEALGPMLLRIREATGASMLVVEHDMPLVRAVSDEILALDLGRAVVQGPPDDVLRDPRVVASYLGTSEVAAARSGP
jgi:branched-chain amino acid transport system ATP-binding protein